MLKLVLFTSYVVVVVGLLYGVRFSTQYDAFFEERMSDHFQHHNKCEPITVQFCQNIEYNQTIMPNLLRHEKQNEAAMDIHSYLPALKVKCSPDIHFFLCSLYVPVCTILDRPVPPCRSLCLRVKLGCESILNKFGLEWPEQLNCNNFPLEEAGVLCISKNSSSSSGGGGGENSDYNRIIEEKSSGHANSDDMSIPKGTLKRNNADTFLPAVASSIKNSNFTCPDNFRVSKGFTDAIKVGNIVARNCGIPCDGIFFNEKEVKFSRMWVGVWSVICAVCSLFTVSTFLINRSRFRYPERPVIFFSICYVIVSVVYILGFLCGRKVACRKPFVPPSDKQGLQTVSTVSQGTKGELCTIMFIALYYFGMASFLWWVILALTWFLAAGLKWGHEAIEANSQYFHLIAWAVPAVKTILILAIGKIEGDILTGVCYVGIWNREMLQAFVLIPLIVYLILGTTFLLLGFASLFRIRKAMKHDGTKTDKLEKLMLRIGIFSILFTIPATIVIMCLLYEQMNFDQWMITWHRKICRKSSPYVVGCPPEGQDFQPNFHIFMIKYLCLLIIGISSSVWMWSEKTISTWKELFYKIRSQKLHAYV